MNITVEKARYRQPPMIIIQAPGKSVILIFVSEERVVESVRMIANVYIPAVIATYILLSAHLISVAVQMIDTDALIMHSMSVNHLVGEIIGHWMRIVRTVEKYVM